MKGGLANRGGRTSLLRRAHAPWRTLFVVFPVMALLAIAAPAHSQDEALEYEVRGVVTDSAGVALRNAMVVALTVPDSVLAKYGLTDGEGRFTLRNLPADEYILQVTLIGYQTLRRDLAVTDSDVDAGTVNLSVMAMEMDSLVVSVDQVPFINRRDTLSYNVLAFETPPNAMVEDLLRRLPGIEVDADGSIKAQGEDVENVLVDGKEFFGTDPTIATRNLPADAIKQVDVYDKQSDMAEFTGIPDGQEERTIDLRLRDDARRGYFGRTTGGLGGDVNNQARIGSLLDNDVRYDGRLNLNRFSPTAQLALTANTNNVNQAGFSWGDLGNFASGLGRGGGSGGGGRNDGFTETLGAGINASRDFGEDSWLRSSYFLSELDNLQNRTLQQQALFGSNVTSLVDETSNREMGNLTQRLNLNGQYTIAPGHDLRVRANFNAGSSSLTSFAQRATQTVLGDQLNTASTDYLVDGSDWRGDARLTWRKRLGDGGRSMVAEFRSGLKDSEMNADLSSTITGESRQRSEDGATGDRGGTEEIVQEQARIGRTWSNSARLSMTQPFGSGYVLEVFGERNAVDEDQEKSVYDLAGGERSFNARLSSGFERTYTYLRGGARFNRNTETSWVTLGLRAQRSQLDGVVMDRPDAITNGYTHLLANMNAKWEVKDGQTLSFRYRTSTREPSMNELQPFTDNTDPLNVYVGNPELQPEYTHRLNADYRFFDQFSFVNLFTFGGFTYTGDNIGRSRTFDERGFQSFTPINTEAAWSVNGGINFGTPIRKLGVDLDLEYRATYSQGTEVVNLAANQSRILRNSLEASVENRVKDVFEVRAGARFDFNDVEYSLNQALNRSYVNSRYFADGTWYMNRAWRIGSTFNFRVYDEGLYVSGPSNTGDAGQVNGSNGTGRNVARWDAHFSRLVMNERAEIELRAYDLLNQNQGVVISNSASFIEESRTESLGQYFMLRVMYRLGTRRGGRGGGGGDGRRGR